MPDLRNPLKAMRKMPTKLARERGQNLKPFILNMLANILIPRTAVYSTNLMAVNIDHNTECSNVIKIKSDINRLVTSMSDVSSAALILDNFRFFFNFYVN